jgi:pimeloyl-ACP methyl ester carboxylesterase
MATRFFCPVLVIIACLFGCRAPGDAPARQVALAPCHVKGVELDMRCGTLDVAENRDKPEGTRLKVWFAIMPAIAKGSVLDPIVVLAGGPGQSDSSVAGLVMPLFAKLNRNRDIVFIDQRGTGHSGALNCPPPKGSSLIASQLDPNVVIDSLDACARAFHEHGIDVTHYLTTDAAQDIDAVRSALGYSRINLWAASYGTRLALEYLRLYPDSARSAVLDGPAPSSLQLPLAAGADTDRALDALIRNCASEIRCKSAHPQLEHDLDALFAKVDDKSLAVTLTDPVTGEKMPLVLSSDVLASWLRTPLYSALTASLVPQAILDAASGNVDSLAALNLSVGGDVIDELSLGMHLSVVCSEDLANVDQAQVTALASTRFRSAFFDLYEKMCAHWPTRKVPAAFFAAPHSSVPVLILAGGLDPATPPAHGEAILPGLSQGRMLVAPNLGHGVSESACAPDLIYRFFREADARSLDGSCLTRLPRPLFFEPIKAKDAA